MASCVTIELRCHTVGSPELEGWSQLRPHTYAPPSSCTHADHVPLGCCLRTNTAEWVGGTGHTSIKKRPQSPQRAALLPPLLPLPVRAAASGIVRSTRLQTAQSGLTATLGWSCRCGPSCRCAPATATAAGHSAQVGHSAQGTSALARHQSLGRHQGMRPAHLPCRPACLPCPPTSRPACAAPAACSSPCASGRGWAPAPQSQPPAAPSRAACRTCGPAGTAEEAHGRGGALWVNATCAGGRWRQQLGER